MYYITKLSRKPVCLLHRPHSSHLLNVNSEIGGNVSLTVICSLVQKDVDIRYKWNLVLTWCVCGLLCSLYQRVYMILYIYGPQRTNSTNRLITNDVECKVCIIYLHCWETPFTITSDVILMLMEEFWSGDKICEVCGTNNDTVLDIRITGHSFSHWHINIHASDNVVKHIRSAILWKE